MTDYVTISKAEIEELRKLQRFTFLSPSEGGVRKYADKAGNHVNFYELAHKVEALLDKAPSVEPVAMINFNEYEEYTCMPVGREVFKLAPNIDHLLYTSPPNPLTSIMLDYIKGEEEFDTTPLESDHIYVKHFKSLIQMRLDEVKELQTRIAELEKDAEIGKLVRSKMISGNDVPVARCHITRAEIEAMEKTNE